MLTRCPFLSPNTEPPTGPSAEVRNSEASSMAAASAPSPAQVRTARSFQRCPSSTRLAMRLSSWACRHLSVASVLTCTRGASPHRPAGDGIPRPMQEPACPAVSTIGQPTRFPARRKSPSARENRPVLVYTCPRHISTMATCGCSSPPQSSAAASAASRCPSASSHCLFIAASCPTPASASASTAAASRWDTPVSPLSHFWSFSRRAWALSAAKRYMARGSTPLTPSPE
mmetsp:Transcript_17731/g.57346  ORF Transcript_17731/g.57346 Transcript_17731/m.57346 type:complete len:229 (-) Transcript_17731:1136-1822(-)